MGNKNKNKNNRNQNNQQQQNNQIIHNSQNNQNDNVINNNNINNNSSNIGIQSGKLVHLDIQMPPNTILVNIHEYDSLQRENLELKAKISEYDKHKLDLLNIINQREKTIDELKKENEMLKQY